MPTLDDLHVRVKPALPGEFSDIVECWDSATFDGTLYGRFNKVHCASQPNFVRKTLRKAGFELDGDLGLEADSTARLAARLMVDKMQAELGWPRTFANEIAKS